MTVDLSAISSRNNQTKAQEILAYKQIFISFDKNKDHALDLSEFNSFLKTLGLVGDELFKKIDKNHDGKLSFNEFQQALPQIKEELFKSLDANHDGVIDSKEVEKFAKDYQFDPKKLLAVLDPHKKGKIGLSDFVLNFGKVLANPQSVSLVKASNQKSSSPSKLKTSQLVQQAKFRKHSVPNTDQDGKIDFFW
jgi:Ca2+-binding EF-hand superfamily protein